MQAMSDVSATGLPVNRPLWFDFPHDAIAWKVTTSYMFGKSMLACPVTAANVTSAVCYLPTLPAGKTWKHFFSKATFPGGANATTATPLVAPFPFPLFQIE